VDEPSAEMMAAAAEAFAPVPEPGVAREPEPAPATPPPATEAPRSGISKKQRRIERKIMRKAKNAK
jgi:hypothetical protein